MESVTPVVIATITEQIRQIMPVYALGTIGGTLDAAGPNWVAAKAIITDDSTLNIIPQALKEKYPDIDFDICIIARDYVTGEVFVFIQDMPHLAKCVATSIEKSSDKNLRGTSNMGSVRSIWKW